MENLNSDQIRYEVAVKRVKKLKGFYTHALVYIVINIIIVINNMQSLESGESYFQFKNFFTDSVNEFICLVAKILPSVF